MTTTIAQSTLNTLNGTSSASGATAAKEKARTTVGQDAFLKLLTTQLKTQDPTDPVDNKDMLAQLASFSNSAGVSEMNTTLKTIAQDIKSQRIGDAAGWIGRAALVSSETATQFPDGRYGGQILLPSAATGVNINLVNASGQVVHSRALGPQPAGSVDFEWDSKNQAGQVVNNGPLRVVVSATGADGYIRTESSTWTAITGVQSPAGGAARLVTPLGLIDPAAAQRLS